jgi:hypothetical protein
MYEVIYRDKDGSRKFLELDMPTKTEVFAELKARGLSAICIKESFKSHSKENAISYWTVITTTLIVGGVIFLSLFFCNFKENKINRTKRSLSKESIKPTSTECTIKQSLTKSFVAKRHVVKTLKINKPVIENSGVLFKPEFNGRLVKWKHREKPVFKNTFENFVGSIITAIPGERFLEIDLEDEFDEAFKASLTNRIEVTSEDSEETAELKRAVIEAKEEVRRQVANGMRPRDIVIAARDELNKVADYRDNLQQEFDNYLVTQKDPTEVLQFVKEANDILAEYGALPLDAPDDLESAEEAILNAIENKVLELEKKMKDPEQKEDTK